MDRRGTEYRLFGAGTARLWSAWAVVCIRAGVGLRRRPEGRKFLEVLWMQGPAGAPCGAACEIDAGPTVGIRDGRKSPAAPARYGFGKDWQGINHESSGLELSRGPWSIDSPRTVMLKHVLLRLVPFLMAFSPLAVKAQAPESVMVVEAWSGKVLIASNASVKRPVASLTKIATGAIAVDWANATGGDMGKIMITVPETITLVGGPNPMRLQPGDRLSLRDALYSALLGSDNLAALAVADHVGRDVLSRRGGGGDPVVAFVGEMNKLGKAIGMSQTRFVNPHGLELQGAQGFSTAADMARISIYAMRRNAFSFIVRQKERRVTVTGPGGERSYNVKNTNELIGEEGILGVKTGTTNAAGPCLSVSMERDPLVRKKPDGSKGVTPRRLIVVVLNNPDRFNRARTLMRQGWGIYDQWLASGAPVQDPQRELLKANDPL